MNFRNLFIWVTLVGLTIYVAQLRAPEANTTQSITFSEFLSKVEANEVKSVVIRGHDLEATQKDDSKISTYAPYYRGMIDILRNHKVDIKADEPKGPSLWLMALVSSVPTLIMICMIMFLMRGSGAGKAMGLGKSKARLMSDKSPRVTFEDVAGIDEAREELKELVDFLQNPDKFKALGGRIPKGCLLVGSPGTGKTLVARAVAGEAGVPFFTISGSDFVEMFVGVGASRVRDMFEQAKKQAPCIIFIDEIDAVGRHRGISLGSGNDEREQTLNQLLVEMDGFEVNDTVIVIAATNRPDVLDAALLRPGRFDRQIMIPLPDLKGRTEILKVHLKSVVSDPSVDPQIIARGTPGFSGAELRNVVNEAALLAARHKKKLISMPEFEEAKDKVMMGAERKSLVMTPEVRKVIAYHESGHAIVALYSKASDPVHKATIVPRGRALGLVMRLPEQDRLNKSKEQLEADVAVAMGGRCAELLIFGEDKIETGASSDIRQATRLARAMVREFGMSDKLGPIFYGSDESRSFGTESHNQFSQKSEELIDSEVMRIVNDGMSRAKAILKQHENALHLVAKALLERETINGDELKALVLGSASSADVPDVVKRKRGRPRKSESWLSADRSNIVNGKRGRPRKPDPQLDTNPPETMKRKRGRPKNPNRS